MKAGGSILIIHAVIIIGIAFFSASCNIMDSEPSVKEQIPTVTTDAVKDITNTTAICTGNVTSCGGSWWVDRGICFSDIITDPTLSNNYSWADAGSHTGTFNAYMEYLTPGITYYVRAYASNNAGNGYGKVISFITSGNVTGDVVFNPDLTYGSLTDIDGNTYKTIKIGSQTWMAENLKTAKYNNGSEIPFVNGLSDWINRNTYGYCWYLNDPVRFKNVYGALYNWHTVNTGRLCPEGWHVPSDAEWTELITYAGGDTIAGRQLKEAGSAHWINTSAKVTNGTGFTALPGGNRWGVITEPVSYFTELGYSGNFWSTTEFSDPVHGYYGAYSRTFFYGWDECAPSAFTKDQGLSVRCVQD
jgi:uncharacterized protein (TIGR02145 family)